MVALVAQEDGTASPVGLAAAIDWLTSQSVALLVIPMGDRLAHDVVVQALLRTRDRNARIYAAAGNSHPAPIAFPARHPGLGRRLVCRATQRFFGGLCGRRRIDSTFDVGQPCPPTSLRASRVRQAITTTSCFLSHCREGDFKCLISAEKAVANHAEPTVYKMPPDPKSAEQKFLSRFNTLDATKQQAATTRVMGLVKATPAKRAQYLDDLATVDETGDTKKVSEVMVHDDFDDGEQKVYSPPKRFTMFSLQEGGNVWPKSYFVTLVLAEKDMGGLADYLNRVLDAVKSEVASALGAAIGGVIGSSGGPLAAIDWIVARSSSGCGPGGATTCSRQRPCPCPLRLCPHVGPVARPTALMAWCASVPMAALMT